MDWIQTVIIAIVEGLTEFLPVSSTGHMIITQNLLGVPQGDPFVHAFTFIIQFGAILSVVCLYWNRFFSYDLRVYVLSKIQNFVSVIIHYDFCDVFADIVNIALHGRDYDKTVRCIAAPAVFQSAPYFIKSFLGCFGCCEKLRNKDPAFLKIITCLIKSRYKSV